MSCAKPESRLPGQPKRGFTERLKSRLSGEIEAELSHLNDAEVLLADFQSAEYTLRHALAQIGARFL